MTPSVDRRRLATWSLLVAPLLLTLVGSLLLDRSSWPAMVGDEPTYAMQAASLAWDFDLAYERRDYDRFVELWGGPPENLILQSTDGGERITFGKPVFFALFAAPFVRILPHNGAALANALLLALACLVAAHTLERRLGSAAPVLVAVAVFTSVAFCYVFWIHADLFLLACTALGLALVFREEHPERHALPEIYDGGLAEPFRRVMGRWLLAGLLLAIPAAVRPFHAALLAAPLFGLPEKRRTAALGAYGLGALLVLGGGLLVHSWSGGSWMGYGSERQGFYSYTGYPDVDFPATEWPRSVERWGNTSWIHEESLAFELSASLWGWNALYLFAGRYVGLLPYFLPLLLGLLAFGGGRLRWALLGAVVLVWASFFLIRPFNFWGGSGAVANRYFLPLFPVFWFLPSRPLRLRWPLVCGAAGLLFVWPLWRAPLAYPLGEGGGYRHVGPLAQRFLPYETTQSHLKPSGQEDVNHRGLWIKFLDRTVGPAPGDRLQLQAESRGRLLVGSPTPLDSVLLVAEGGSGFQIQGAGLGEMLLRPDGAYGYELLLEGHLRARHPMWWTWEPFYLYEITLSHTSERVVPFTLQPGTFRQLDLGRHERTERSEIDV